MSFGENFVRKRNITKRIVKKDEAYYYKPQLLNILFLLVDWHRNLVDQ